MNRSGFTLIEVMISMVIMAGLTVLVSASIRSAVQNKKKLEDRISMETSLYDALRVIKLDVERAFHYHDVFYEIEKLAIQNLQAAKNNPGGQGNNNQAPPVAPPQNSADPFFQVKPAPPQLTQFLGDGTSLHFTALNHYRTRYNAQESNQMEVGYFVDSCQRRDGKGSTKCLWRRTSIEIDDKVDEGGPKVAVVEDVDEFVLEYRSNEEDAQWVKQWRSDNRGRPDHRNKFPHFVKIKLSLEKGEGKRKKTMQQTIVVQIQFPNNEPIVSQQQNFQRANQNQ